MLATARRVRPVIAASGAALLLVLAGLVALPADREIRRRIAAYTIDLGASFLKLTGYSIAYESLSPSILGGLGLRQLRITDAEGRRVSQAYCSALPVSYGLRGGEWEPFGRLVLQAAYEATLLAAVEQAAGGGSNKVLLTRLGGGAFGNEDAWINDAIERAVEIVGDAGLDISIVCYGHVDSAVKSIVDHWNGR